MASPASDRPAMPRALMLGTLAVLVVIVVANNSMGALAQPEIAEAFLAGPADVGWVVFGFSASFAVSTAIWGAIGRRFGIGRGLAAGIVVLSIFSLAAAAAPSLPLLVAARVIQGFGAGAIPTLGTALIGTRYSGPSRASALGVIVGSVGTGQAVGPLLGGALIDLAGWRAVVGLAVLVAPTAAIMLRSHPAAGDNQARIDITGALLVGIAAFAAVLALNRLPVDGLAPLTIIAVASLVLALPAVGWHSLVRGGSFLPKQVLLEPTYRRLVLLGAVGMSAFLGSIVIVPIAISRVQGLMGLELGLVLVPMALTTALLSPNNGRVTRRLGHANTVHLSLGLLAAGPLSLAVLGAGASPIALAAALVPLGAGFSLLNAPLLEQLMLVFEGPLAPIAVGSYNLLFFLGGSLGAALSTALVEARVRLPLMPAGSAEPGFVTSAVLLCVLPAAAALLLGRARMRMSQ